VAFVAGCAVNPVTGQREFSLISEAQEIQMGTEADAQIVAQMGLHPDADLQEYVSDLGMRMALASERPDLPWTFRVVDDPMVNAFALPGGFVYITRGIMAHLTSEAELVGVLGHEIGHVTARHSASQISRQQLLGGLVGAGMIFVEELRPYGEAAALGLQLMSRKYGRDDERQADDLGFRYMTTAGYNPTELIDVFATLEALGGGADASGIPSWLASHPDPGERQVRIQEQLASAALDPGQLDVNENPYLQRLDGMIFGENPREGYFEGTTLHHPDLEFRIDFPASWQTLNGKQAVQGVSPQNDAAMILELAEAASADAALQTFFSEGVTRVASSSDRVNGSPARWGEFSAETEQGVLRGMVVFVEYGGLVYSIMGFAPSAAWTTHAGTVRAALGSFQRERDPAVLSIQPDRVGVVSLPTELSIAAFMDRFPSSVPSEQIALINHVRGSGNLPTTRLAKRVIGG